MTSPYYCHVAAETLRNSLMTARPTLVLQSAVIPQETNTWTNSPTVMGPVVANAGERVGLVGSM